MNVRHYKSRSSNIIKAKKKNKEVTKDNATKQIEHVKNVPYERTETIAYDPNNENNKIKTNQKIWNNEDANPSTHKASYDLEKKKTYNDDMWNSYERLPTTQFFNNSIESSNLNNSIDYDSYNKQDTNVYNTQIFDKKKSEIDLNTNIKNDQTLVKDGVKKGITHTCNNVKATPNDFHLIKKNKNPISPDNESKCNKMCIGIDQNYNENDKKMKIVTNLNSLTESTNAKEIIKPNDKPVTEVNKSTCDGVTILFKGDRRFFNFNIPQNEIIEKNDIEIMEFISEGSFGAIYKAMWNNQIIAIKKFNPSMTLEGMRSIAREINAYRSISHKYIVKYYGVCIDSDFIGIILEYFNKGNVFDTLHKGGFNLSYEMRLRICTQLAEAMKYLHEDKKLVHRDLKTSNILFDNEYNIKVCDFGKTMKLSDNGKVILEDNGGSLGYMAPECFIEGNAITEKSDMWGLSCCFIEIFSNQVPFQNIKEKEDIVVEILVNKKKPNIPTWFNPEFTEILKRSFSTNPSKRPSCQEFLNLMLKYAPKTGAKHHEIS
ncbi:protein kinase, putative [Plasmodium chabaudi chabaudi]|uniref:Protein kinase, putative n=1 Tax=Plasmodium chabaudi chabaudi TaxID=31271 RepID=A0A4V0KAE6_PLACU|nr:protein kinase, putative [Plasmodium chabaudi chabaudi]VTZ69766.1 protein kinase, putative [Plasmodium chabaudi chabaudi]|eukprot:XP_016654293.1 protein kinase, putative [Plasmodium chabaudi chabaudi]